MRYNYIYKKQGGNERIMLEKENFSIQITDTMLYDRLSTLSMEYSLSKEYLVDLALRRFLNDVELFRNLRNSNTENIKP